jgi:hypothetical protein
MNFQTKEYPGAFTETITSQKNGRVFAEADYEKWIRSFDSAGENDSGEKRYEAEPRSNGRDAGATSGEWGDPDWSLLDDRRGQLPDFPLAVLSPEIRNFLERSAHGAGVVVDHVAVPLLSIASSLVGTSRRIAPSRSWSEPCAVWTAVVGYSGTGKTPGLDVAKRALSNIERERRDKIAQLRLDHVTRQETAKAAQKKWKAEVQAAVDSGQPAPPMPPNAVEPGEFTEPRLYVSDATIERLAVLLEARPSGIQLIGDELAGLFLNFGRYSGGQDKEFWLEAWNGKYFVVERMGRPPVVVEHLLVGVTGGFQPDKLVRSFEGDDDGMYARFLFGWPQEPKYQALSNSVAEDEPELANAFTRLIDLSGNDGVVRRIHLAHDAVEEFERFRQFLHTAKESLDGREREWWAKGATHVLRLAGTLAYLDWAWRGSPEPTEVAANYVTAPVELWREYFWPHSRAALRQVGLTDRHRDARRALRWIRGNGKTEVSVKDIRRDALGERLDAQQTLDLLNTLVSSGWLLENTPKSGPKGGKPARRWKVNPSIRCNPETAETAETAETQEEQNG